STTLSYNSVNATSALAVTTGAGGTTAAQVQTNLQTIAALAGANIAVTGNTGGPFTITFGGSLQGDVSQIASSSTAQATTATTTNGSAPSASAVQTNLQTIAALSAAGNVTVTGSQPIYTITFGGALAGQNVSQLVSSTPPAATTAAVIG